MGVGISMEKLKQFMKSKVYEFYPHDKVILISVEIRIETTPCRFADMDVIDNQYDDVKCDNILSSQYKHTIENEDGDIIVKLTDPTVLNAVLSVSLQWTRSSSAKSVTIHAIAPLDLPIGRFRLFNDEIRQWCIEDRIVQQGEWKEV